MSCKHTFISFFTNWALPLLWALRVTTGGLWKLDSLLGTRVGGGRAQTQRREMGRWQPDTAVMPSGTPGEKTSLLCVVVC